MGIITNPPLTIKEKNIQSPPYMKK